MEKGRFSTSSDRPRKTQYFGTDFKVLGFHHERLTSKTMRFFSTSMAILPPQARNPAFRPIANVPEEGSMYTASDSSTRRWHPGIRGLM